MNRILFSSLMLSGMLAFSANAADFGGKLFVEDAEIVPGESAVLSIQLENDIDVSGFQFQMILPTGIAYQEWAISEERLPVGATTNDLISIQRYDNGTLTLASVLNCGAGAKFTMAQGELATVSIVASPNIPLGTYLVELRGIDVCDPMGNDYEVPASTFTLTVGETTGIETLRSESSNAQIYDLQGRRQSEVSAGQTGIVNGRAVYRK
jgi:hypothetical protein